MGFWHTGYIEHHESSGLNYTYAPTPIRYRCALCEEVFDKPDDLRRHRFEQHPYTQPSLFVRGIQLGATPFRITRASSAADFMVDRALKAEVNGTEKPVNVLAKTLAAFTNDRVTITLFNEGARATFEVIFNIASEFDLLGLESCFQNLAQTKHLDTRAIERFIGDSKPYTSAAGYCDGICQYLYGVLAKERARDSKLEYAAYRDKFNQAADTLAAYDRPIARHIRALVAFHFNHFADVEYLLPKGRLAVASHRYNSWLKGSEDTYAVTPRDAVARDSIDNMLTDLDTDRILRWALADSDTMKTEMADVEAMLGQDISEFDRVKLVMLLAEQCARDGQVVKARRYARELVNIVSTANWAQKLLERLPMENRE